jgi:quercetin dioxygenase-like cupin family protein
MRLALLAACLAMSAASAQHGSHTIVMPKDLKWDDVASLPPGAKVAVIEGRMNQEGPITARIRLPANYKIPPHYHPGVERVTVLSGTVHIGMGDRFDAGSTTAMEPGTVLLMSPGMHHFAWTKEEAIFQLNVTGPWSVTYLNPADDPRKKRPD